jgi:acetolactate synthase I/II/III large subunit
MQYKLNMVHIILNDNAFGMIKWKQRLAGFESWGLDLVNPDFVTLAKAYGVHGRRVTEADEFASILQSCLDTEGTYLIEVPFSYDSMSAELQRVPAKAEAAVRKVAEEYSTCVIENCLMDE